MSGKIDGVGLTTTAIGAVLVYGGIRGYSILQLVQNIVSGKSADDGISVSNPLNTIGGTGTSTADITDTNGVGAVPPGGNQALGMALASEMYGWEGAEWVALQKLWNRESSWNNKAKNPSSGAYGIPQSLPYSKMPKAAWPESAGGKSDATAQIKWGLKYIKSVYGTPSKAWAHETAKSWY